jgi:D-sedoheptulose 7-phosphate isomerase
MTSADAKPAIADPSLDKTSESFRDKIHRKCGESMEMKERFFSQYAERIEAMSRDMAERFAQGRKLLVMGNGGSLCDALHFSVEFAHPIIEKRRGFPVIPLMTDIATITAIGNDSDYSRVFIDQLQLLGQPGDMALAVSTSGKSPNLIYAVEAAREKQMLTIAWLGKDGGRLAELADYAFIVPSYSIHRIQEVHATLVHIAWDLIHIALGEEDVV